MAVRPLALFPNLSLCLDAESCPRVLTWLEDAQLTFCACVCCHASSIGIRRGLRPFRNRASPVPILVRELDDGLIGQLSGCLVVSLFVQLLRLSKPEVGHILRQSPKLLVLRILCRLIQVQLYQTRHCLVYHQADPSWPCCYRTQPSDPHCSDWHRLRGGCRGCHVARHALDESVVHTRPILLSPSWPATNCAL